MGKGAKIARSILLFVILAPVIFVGYCEYRRALIADGFDQVKVGDDLATVERLLGKPAEIMTCRPKDHCSQELFYYSFLERWMIYAGPNGVVVDKLGPEVLY